MWITLFKPKGPSTLRTRVDQTNNAITEVGQGGGRSKVFKNKKGPETKDTP